MSTTTAPTGPETREPAAVSRDAPTDAAVVTAVVVAHNGARWLPGLVAALTAQTRAVDRILAVDTGSRDDSAEILRRELGDRAVLTVDKQLGFGAAVVAAVATLTNVTTTPQVASIEQVTHWLWLVHDDCLPLPGTLDALLSARDARREIAVIGPKIRGWSDQTLLLEAGVTIARSGRRETGLERNEVDQGQHDDTRDVLAVSSAGMLVRRRCVGPPRRVRPAARAVPRRRRLRLARSSRRTPRCRSARGRRAPCCRGVERPAHDRCGHPTPPPARPPQRALRPARHLPARSLPWAYVRLTIASLLRVAGFALGKLPGAMLDELAAVGTVVLRPDRVFAARRWRQRTRTASARDVQTYLAPRGAQLTRLLDVVAGVFTRGHTGGAEVLTRGHRSVETGPAHDDLEDLEPVGLRWVRGVLLPGPVLVAALLVLALVAGRHLLGSGRLMDGALLPSPDGARDLWRTYLGARHDVGLGARPSHRRTSRSSPASARSCSATRRWRSTY